MPDIEETLKTEIRLYALETLVCQLYVWFYEMSGKPPIGRLRLSEDFG